MDDETFHFNPELEDNFQMTAQSLPFQVQSWTQLDDVKQDRHFRQMVMTVFSNGQNGTQPVSQLVELLALTADMNPASFTPSFNLNDMAMAKLSTYSGLYLYGQYQQVLSNSHLSEKLKDRFFNDAQAFWLAHTDRLHINFNQTEHVANYLQDVKARTGRLTTLSAMLGTFLTKPTTDYALVEMIGAIGETLGVIYTILVDADNVAKPEIFRDQLMTGNYSLPVLFAIEEETQFFTDFFHQKTKPTADQFEQARQLARMAGLKLATDMAKELIDQTKIDAKNLPEGPIKGRLSDLLEQLTELCTEKDA